MKVWQTFGGRRKRSKDGDLLASEGDIPGEGHGAAYVRVCIHPPQLAERLLIPAPPPGHAVSDAYERANAITDGRDILCATGSCGLDPFTLASCSPSKCRLCGLDLCQPNEPEPQNVKDRVESTTIDVQEIKTLVLGNSTESQPSG